MDIKLKELLQFIDQAQKENKTVAAAGLYILKKHKSIINSFYFFSDKILGVWLRTFKIENDFTWNLIKFLKAELLKERRGRACHQYRGKKIIKVFK